MDAEWGIIYQKLDNIAASGAKVVLSRLAIGDLATQYFADRDIFCAGRVRCRFTAMQRRRFQASEHRGPTLLPMLGSLLGA